MFPAVTPQNRVGLPSARNGSALRQSGWSRMPTRNPWPSSSRPMRAMPKLGWDSCDVVLVTGDAYVDHPSFGAALIGRLLEAQGFRVGIVAQPDLSLIHI